MLGDIFGVIIPAIQKSLECDDNNSKLKEEADKLNKKLRILNEEIDNYNREVLTYNREWFPPPSYTQQIEQMKSDLNEKSIRLNEKIKAHNNNFDSLTDKCNLIYTKIIELKNINRVYSNTNTN